MAGGQQHEQSDGTGTDDDDRAVTQVADRFGGPPDRVHRGGQRFDEDRVAVVQVGLQRDQPIDGDGERVGQPTGCLAAQHQQFAADVVAAVSTLGAVPAGEVGFHCYPGADPGRIDAGTDRIDDADNLMSGPVGQVNEGVAAARGMQIGPAEPHDRAAHPGLTGRRRGLRHRLDDHVVERIHHHAPVYAGCCRAHHAVYPPSATRTDPVMKDAASLARKTTLGAISSGRA